MCWDLEGQKLLNSQASVWPAYILHSITPNFTVLYKINVLDILHLLMKVNMVKNHVNQLFAVFEYYK